MINTKFLSGWNAHLALASDDSQSMLSQMNATQLQTTISSIMNLIDAKDYLYGFFQAFNYASVTPFIATHDYCIKVLYCSQDGRIEMNVSPIYHLGLEYPETYKNKHGKNLDENAVIGLLEKPVAGTLPPGHMSYTYGVDAGILFKDSNISHNKKLTLKLEEIRDGLLTTLSCDNQSTSATMAWTEIELHNSQQSHTNDAKITEILSE